MNVGSFKVGDVLINERPFHLNLRGALPFVLWHEFFKEGLDKGLSYHAGDPCWLGDTSSPSGPNPQHVYTLSLPQRAVTDLGVCPLEPNVHCRIPSLRCPLTTARLPRG